MNDKVEAVMLALSMGDVCLLLGVFVLLNSIEDFRMIKLGGLWEIG